MYKFLSMLPPELPLMSAWMLDVWSLSRLPSVFELMLPSAVALMSMSRLLSVFELMLPSVSMLPLVVALTTKSGAESTLVVALTTKSGAESTLVVALMTRPFELSHSRRLGSRSGAELTLGLYCQGLLMNPCCELGWLD